MIRFFINCSYFDFKSLENGEKRCFNDIFKKVIEQKNSSDNNIVDFESKTINNDNDSLFYVGIEQKIAKKFGKKSESIKKDFVCFYKSAKNDKKLFKNEKTKLVKTPIICKDNKRKGGKRLLSALLYFQKENTGDLSKSPLDYIFVLFPLEYSDFHK